MSRLIKVENKSKEEIAEICRKIGEAFAAESKKNISGAVWNCAVRKK